MDDVCAIVGWSRAVALTQWFAGMNLYIPAEPGEDHVLLVLLGSAPLQRLIDEFGGASVWIPASLGGQHAGADAMKRDVRRLILRGKGSRAISEELGITQRQAQRIRVELEAAGMLPKILGEKSPEKHP
jgi:hypothetical protein